MVGKVDDTDKARRIGRRRGMDDGADAELDKVDGNPCGASSSGNIGQSFEEW